MANSWRRRLFAAAAGASMVAPAALATFVEGAYPGMTGGFGEPTCHHCHFDRPLNESPGSVMLSAVPVHYTPGGRYLITVVLKRPDVSRGGFQLAVRFADGPRAGRQAGAVAPVDPTVQAVDAPTGEVRYVQHTKDGSETMTPGELRWVVNWVAPAEGAGRVVFHVAANASNADDSPLGDFVYTTEAQSQPASRAAWRSH